MCRNVNEQAAYWYEGVCPRSQKPLRLPRTKFVEEIANQLMQDFAADEQYSREGKMYGVLLTETAEGKPQILKAFSGLLNGKSIVQDWVSPIAGRDRVQPNESITLTLLESLKQQIIQQYEIPQREQYRTLSEEYGAKLGQLSEIHKQRKLERQQKRQNNDNLELNEQSKRDGIEKRNLKRDRDSILNPLKQTIDQSDQQIRQLKQQRKQLSQQLQSEMYDSYRITNFAGETRSLSSLLSSMPTGTGECCAPKLLHHAATHGLKPLAMAEFWWGESIADKIQGEFYGACVDRCQPILGFLLSGLESIDIVYQDDCIVVVNKPSGLLSTRGRYGQDCVLDRFSEPLIPVHRLDQDTSGLLILARDTQTYKQLSEQFQQRKIRKVYEAILSRKITQKEGTIDLPLLANVNDRPKQIVDPQRGKLCITNFRVLGDSTRVEFYPITGRTHQLRVHAAQGLGAAIVGDRLYGDPNSGDRLHLHARDLQFTHRGQILTLKTVTPF